MDNNSIENCTELNELIEKIRYIVKFINKSVNVSDELRKF